MAMFADVLVSQDADGEDVEESPVDDALVRERIVQLDGANRSLSCCTAATPISPSAATATAGSSSTRRSTVTASAR